MPLVLLGALPRLIRLAIADHEGPVSAAKDERGLAARRSPRECRALLAEGIGGLGQEKAEELLGRQRVVDGNLGQRLEQHATPAGLVHLVQGRQSFVTELRRHALTRQQRDIHRPVPDVVVFALDEDELVVREAPS